MTSWSIRHHYGLEGYLTQGLGQEVKNLKGELKDALEHLEGGQREAKQERLIRELEAQNQELEQALTSTGEVLQ
jgi:hypothetical protein